MNGEGQIPPTLPLQKGGIPLFGKEGLGEIFATICLFNYGLLSKYVLHQMEREFEVPQVEGSS